jgi:hypothetical protein
VGRNVHTACFAVKGPGGEEHSLFHSPSCGEFCFSPHKFAFL